jgi:hypothetical protein
MGAVARFTELYPKHQELHHGGAEILKKGKCELAGFSRLPQERWSSMKAEAMALLMGQLECQWKAEIAF